MKDRYLFRGKRIDNGEWIDGSLMMDTYKDIEENEVYGIYPNGRDYVKKIDPSTICQCTGLKDKTGKLIWENDIVKDKDENLYRVFWHDNYFQFSWTCVKSPKIPVGAKWNLWCVKSYKEVEVIGNVFDNPELLEVQE